MESERQDHYKLCSDVSFITDNSDLNSKIAIQPTFSREFYNGDAIVRASRALKKISSIEANRKIYSVLKKEMNANIHSLQIVIL